ncbi:MULTISPECIES: substrate-binding domain-containing protein [unclassified Janthinobacterium]|uniref:substrate-binding domain-containing protein n=1 Tax=unclassified Janthinobacterium TaxID=2610881 RepID=UPI001615D4BB|nr:MULTISPECIES: substrate-binding domain-containing protein [unclassified Janthinobacterium]MBB5368946.1 LacI family transcriptional regulator [Janthinobacterium sp. K2C7]MBB5381518.1 LacI family transcriptional regulator [Janthinobacterium sp. K2Li3]MBB5387328.1 LacI family transcriptional regulator [Janthinobacterium sp. K2E3]
MNLKNLAKTLGISETTVSRALNGYPEVSERTRERVMAAAQAAGYRPNPMARSLAVGRTNIVGIIYPLMPNDLADPMFIEIVGGMSEALEAQQMDMIIAPASASKEFHTYERMVTGRRIDALVVGRTKPYDERIAYLAQQGLPFVAHGRTQLNQPHAWFDYDNEAGMRLAVERLLSLGHQRIGLISATPDLNFVRQRVDSFRNAMQAGGLAVDPDNLVDNAHDRRAGYQAMQRLLARAPRPTAVIVDNHMSGVGAVRALLDAGIAIGSEMSLIVWGVMEDSLAGHNVTTVVQPDPRGAGAKMIQMLLALMDGTPATELQELWPCELLPGESAGRVASS